MTTHQRRIWFNRGLATVYDQLRLIRESDSSREFAILASAHPEPNAMDAVADERFDEPPSAISDQAYVDWAIQICRDRAIDLFVPGRRREAIARRAKEFAPTILSIPASADLLDLFEEKDRFFDSIRPLGIPQAAFRTFATLAEFDTAREQLADHELCIKPVRGLFAAGFYRLIDGDPYRRLVESTPYVIGLEDYRRILATATTPRRFMVMQYLPGTERSVDCLAHRGELVVAISRVKKGSVQVTETSGPAVDIARTLIRHFTIDGIVNVQTRDDDSGVPHLLEINARASGGLAFAALAGTALPYWSAKLALGLADPREVPQPQAGVVVAPITAAVIVNRPQGS